MRDPSAPIFAASKVTAHQDRIDAYLRGERVFPITIELDLTQCCTRACAGCPYGLARQDRHSLDLAFLEGLFGILGPHVPGIVLSGGEPTLTPHFSETLHLARQKGFRQIAVISNGTRLEIPEVQDAVLRYATSIRISLYDWQKGDSAGFRASLDRIANLKRKVTQFGSPLEVGASMLTRTEWTHRIVPVGLQALQTGIDWLYFHPYCIDWDVERPVQANQTGVLDAIVKLRELAPPGSNIQVPAERYSSQPLRFSALHGAHFLIQIGADGVNYAGPECKYHRDYALLDVRAELHKDFLWDPQRLQRIAAINSDNYTFIGTKHRPPMFSDYIERQSSTPNIRASSASARFLYPDII